MSGINSEQDTWQVLPQAWQALLAGCTLIPVASQKSSGWSNPVRSIHFHPAENNIFPRNFGR